MGPYAEVDYNVTLCPLQSRLQHIYHGQPYMPESTWTLCQSRLYPPDRDFGFGLSWEKDGRWGVRRHYARPQPIIQQASEKINKDDVNGFSSISYICFMLTTD